MLTDSSIEFTFSGTMGVPLVWIIDQQCLYDLALSKENASIFTNATDVLDVSGEYPDHLGITVRFMNGPNVLDDFQTSEYFGSILLSNPLVLNLLEHPYGSYVSSPHALYIDGSFVILDRDPTVLDPNLHG